MLAIYYNKNALFLGRWKKSDTKNEIDFIWSSSELPLLLLFFRDGWMDAVTILDFWIKTFYTVFSGI